MSDDLHALLQKVKDLRSRHDRLSAQVTSFTAHTRRLVSILTPTPVETIPLAMCSDAKVVSTLEIEEEREPHVVTTRA